MKKSKEARIIMLRNLMMAAIFAGLIQPAFAAQNASAPNKTGQEKNAQSGGVVWEVPPAKSNATGQEKNPSMSESIKAIFRNAGVELPTEAQLDIFQYILSVGAKGGAEKAKEERLQAVEQTRKETCKMMAEGFRQILIIHAKYDGSVDAVRGAVNRAYAMTDRLYRTCAQSTEGL